jgi:thiamine transport system permease protein
MDFNDEPGSKMNWILSFPAFFILIMGFVAPLMFLFALGLRDFSDSVLRDPFLLYVIQFTYFQALVSSVLSVGFGFFTAWMIKEWRVRGGSWLWKICLLCSSLPAIIVALGILGTWGPGGLGSGILSGTRGVFGWTGIILGHVFLNFAIPLRLIGNALRERDRSAEMTALSLGMSRLAIFGQITLPKIKPSIVCSFILAFLFSSTSLFIVLFLGGGPRFTTLEVSLYEAIKLNLDNSRACQIASVQAIICTSILFLYLRSQKGSFLNEQVHRNGIFRPRTKWIETIGSCFMWSLVVFLIGLPLISILVDGVGVLHFLNLVELSRAALISLGIAFGVAVLSLAILYPLLHAVHHEKSSKTLKGLSWLVGLPQFFSSLVVALGLSVFYPSIRGNNLQAYLAIVVAQTLFVIPLIQFPLREGFQRYSKEQDLTAQSLGANRWQRFLWVEFPSMKRSLILSALIAAGFSLGEVATVLLFSPAEVQTLSLSIFQAMSRYRFQEAHAMTVILLVVMVLIFGVVGKLEEKDD